MRPITIFLILISTLNIYAQDKIKISDYEKELENSYKKNSKSELEKFLKNWNLLFKPIELEKLNNKEEKAIYEFYPIFYSPKELLKLGNWEWGNDLNKDSQFIIIQNKIKYNVLDVETLEKINEKNRGIVLKSDSIMNFRPYVDFPTDKVLYSTPEYKISLTKFLGTQSTKFGKPNIMSVSRPKAQSEKRYSFIRPYLPILHGHWGGYWHIETNPTIYALDLNKNLTEAKIYYSVGYQGGEAYIIKENQIWTIKESKETWIE